MAKRITSPTPNLHVPAFNVPRSWIKGDLRDLTLPTDTYRPSSIRDTLHSGGGFQEMGSEKSSLFDQQIGDPGLFRRFVLIYSIGTLVHPPFK
jgi:hypothetical protein